MAKKAVTREDILEQALSDIRGRFGEGAIMRLGDEVQRAVEVIHSGILPLDVALGIGGVPRGRVKPPSRSTFSPKRRKPAA